MWRAFQTEGRSDLVLSTTPETPGPVGGREGAVRLFRLVCPASHPQAPLSHLRRPRGADPTGDGVGPGADGRWEGLVSEGRPRLRHGAWSTVRLKGVSRGRICLSPIPSSRPSGPR